MKIDIEEVHSNLSDSKLAEVVLAIDKSEVHWDPYCSSTYENYYMPENFCMYGTLSVEYFEFKSHRYMVEKFEDQILSINKVL